MSGADLVSVQLSRTGPEQRSGRAAFAPPFLNSAAMAQWCDCPRETSPIADLSAAVRG